MVTMMILVGGFGLLFGIYKMVAFTTGLAAGELEQVGPRRSEDVMLSMVLMVFGLLVCGLGVLWAIAGHGS